MDYFKSNYNIISIILFVTVIALAHFLSTNNYEWTRNTISDLGSQGYSRKIIMQIGFVSFGLILSTGILMKGLSWRTVPIFIYGLCIVLTGFFCTKPFFTVDIYSKTEDIIHSILAQIAGATFTVGILLQIPFSTDKTIKLSHLIFFLLIVGLSASFGLLKNYQGITQRLLYLTSFVWLIKYYKT